MFFFSFVVLCCLQFFGCGVTTSGNNLGEAAVLKYSTDEKKLRYIETNVTYVSASSDYSIESPHYKVGVGGFAFSSNIELLLFDFSLFN